MVSVSVKIDPKSFEEFQRALTEFATELGKDFQDEAIHQGHLLCVDAMIFTPPMPKGGGRGLKKPAQTAGELAIKGDVKSFAIGANKRSAAFLMYRKLGDAAFRNDQSYFYRVINNSQKAVKNITNPIMIKIAQDPDHARAFKKARNLFNKYAPQTNPDGLYDKMYDDIRPMHEKYKTKFNKRAIRFKIGSGMSWLNKHIASDESVIKREIDRSNMQVGALKAGWYKAKQRLPKFKSKKIDNPGGTMPAWIIRHTAATGLCNFSLNDKTVSLSVINTIGDNNNVATDANTKSIVYGKRVKTLTQDLQKKLEARAAKFNKK